jgi:hypothetical protein
MNLLRVDHLPISETASGSAARGYVQLELDITLELPWCKPWADTAGDCRDSRCGIREH